MAEAYLCCWALMLQWNEQLTFTSWQYTLFDLTADVCVAYKWHAKSDVQLTHKKAPMCTHDTRNVHVILGYLYVFLWDRVGISDPIKARSALAAEWLQHMPCNHNVLGSNPALAPLLHATPHSLSLSNHLYTVLSNKSENAPKKKASKQKHHCCQSGHQKVIQPAVE